MTAALQRLSFLAVIAVLAGGLGGCGTVNGWLAAGFENFIPAWAGGLPADAPPRPGTLKYDEFMRQRERQRLEPAARKDDPASSAAQPLGPVY